MNNRTLYLHVGLHKTGTTAIQEYLHKHLDYPDYDYFDVGRPNPSLIIVQAFKDNFQEHPSFEGRQMGDAQVAALRNAARTTFDAALEKTSKPNVIMSAEGISSLTPPECEKFLKEMQERFSRVQVILYIRPMKSRVESAFQEKLKTHLVSLDEQFIFNYRKTISKFDWVIGQENVLVLPFTPEQFPDGNVVADFLDRVGLDSDIDAAPRANRGLSLPAVQLLYSYRQHYSQPIPADRQLFELLQEMEGPSFHLHSDLFEKIHLDRGDRVACLTERAGFDLGGDRGSQDELAVRSADELNRIPASSVTWLNERLAQYKLPHQVSADDPKGLASALREMAHWRKAVELRQAGLAISENEILLHVGLPKTATTSIQATCARNEERLSQHGWQYPVFHLDERRITNHTIPLVGLVDDNNHVAIRWGVDPVEARQDYDRQIREFVSRDDLRHTLLSAEGVSEWDLKRLPALHQYLQGLSCRLRLVAVVRDPMEWIQSLVQQYVKMGRVLETLDFGNMAVNLKNRFLRLERVFGDDLTVLDFEKLKAHPQGVVGGFLHDIGFSDELLGRMKFIRVNESWSDEAIRMASHINRELPLYDGNALTAGRSDKDLHCLEKLPGEKFRLSPDQYADALEHMTPVGQWLQDRYGIIIKAGQAEAPADWSDEAVGGLAPVLDKLPSPELQAAAKAFLQTEADMLVGNQPQRAAALSGVLEELSQ